MLQTFSPKDLISKDLIFWWLTLECSIYSCISSGEANQQVTLLLRVTYGVEFVSAARLVNTARPTLSTARLGKFGVVRQIWCCQANLVLPGKFGAAKQKFVLLVTVTTVKEQNRFSLIKDNLSMANLEFVDQHNMVACLEKTEGNSNFHKIVDFLASSSIHHALTINATVDSKTVVVTEASIRSSLLFNDADGTACLTNEAIFQDLALMGYEAQNLPAGMSFPQILLQLLYVWPLIKSLTFLNLFLMLGEPFNDVYPTPAHNLKVFSNMSRKGVKFSGKVTPLFDSMLVPHQAPEGEDSRDSLEETNRNERDQVQTPHDSALSGGHTSDRAEGTLNLQELSVLCTNLSNKVLALESIKDAQATEINSLKSRIKKLEKKCKPSISHHRAWLKSVKRLSMKKRFGKHDWDEGRQRGETEECKYGCEAEVLLKTRSSGEKGGKLKNSLELQEPKMKEEKAKEKGVSFKDIEDSSRPERSILTLKPLPTIDPKDKGKKIARQLQVDLQAEGLMLMHYYQACFKQEEREEYTIDERAKFLAETIAAQRKFRAAQRSAEIRSRPPTKSQLRNLMMTYQKNMGGYKHSQLKAKSFEEIKGMYERQKKSVQDFVPIGSAKEEELIKKMNKKATNEDTSNKEKVLEEPDSTKVEVKQEGHEDSTRKRPGRRLKMKATKKSKRQKTDSDHEEEEQLKAFLMIVLDEEGIIDYEVLEKRLVVGTASEDAYTLLRFIQKQIDEYGSHDGGEKDL
ncbi:hypothetical protein Tco_1530141 [Tanacetum coccineum]